MKTLRFIGIALVALIVSFSLAACSDDDDEEGGTTGMAGSTWEITECPDDASFVGMTFTFNANGTMTTNPIVWNDIEWSMEGDTLSMALDGGNQYMDGTLSIDGNRATYNYTIYTSTGATYYGPTYVRLKRK